LVADDFSTDMTIVKVQLSIFCWLNIQSCIFWDIHCSSLPLQETVLSLLWRD